MTLIKPFTSMDLSCGGCGDECQVVVWNGVKDWDMVPSPDLMAQDGRIIVTLKVSPLSAETMAAWAADSGPHVADRVLVWAQDEATYNLIVKLLSNPTAIHRPEEDDDAPHKPH